MLVAYQTTSGLAPALSPPGHADSHLGDDVTHQQASSSPTHPPAANHTGSLPCPAMDQQLLHSQGLVANKAGGCPNYQPTHNNQCGTTEGHTQLV